MLERISFLFGSGVSILAGMPSVKEITERVLSGVGIMRHTDGNYYFGKPLYAHAGFHDEYIPRVLAFLKRLLVEIESYYDFDLGRKINYEDLYYLAAQIHDSEVGEYDNPAVQPLIDKIMLDIKYLLVGQDNEIRKKWKLHEIAGEATHYIQDIVWHLLSKELKDLNYLQSIGDACQDSGISCLDIFTLNNDNVLENFLLQRDIKFVDGFGSPVNRVRYWSPELFEEPSFNVRLFKLHGSIKWFLLKPDGKSWEYERIGIPLDSDIWHTKNSGGDMQMPVHGRPMFLAGTFNKMLQYTSGIYAELHCQLYRTLRHVPILIVCGYGFGDKGINSQIVEWMYYSKRNTMILIHAQPERLRSGARGSIQKNWNNWLGEKKLSIISKWIEEISWEELRNTIAVTIQ
jgi:hypothetical protein